MVLLEDLGGDGAGDGVEVAELGEVEGAVGADGVAAGWGVGVDSCQVREGGVGLGLSRRLVNV